MNSKTPKDIFLEIRDRYNAIKSPKYRNIDPEELKKDYELLVTLKPQFTENVLYNRLINAMSQTISRMQKSMLEIDKWSNVSERSMNKVIKPVVKKRNNEIDFPLEWTDKSGHKCLINNGYWGARNYMVMDIMAYMFLLKEGGDRLPEEDEPLFADIDSVRKRETELTQTTKDLDENNNGTTEIAKTILNNERYYVKFRDSDFRRFTSLKLNSNDILKLLQDTSRVEFKLAFPIRLWEDSKKLKERIYTMNVFSRTFELAYVDKKVRSDGIVKEREYRVIFNTILGELFAHNLKTRNYDWLDKNFYNLPNSAQIFYRKFILNNDFLTIPVNIETLKERLSLEDKNIPNLIGTIEASILKPLKDYGLLLSYEKKKGLDGTKFIIKRTPRITKGQSNSKTSVARKGL